MKEKDIDRQIKLLDDALKTIKAQEAMIELLQQQVKLLSSLQVIRPIYVPYVVPANPYPLNPPWTITC